MSRSKKNWDQLVDKYGAYDIAGLIEGVNGVTGNELSQALSGYVKSGGDTMSGGLFLSNALGYSYAIEPLKADRPAGTVEFMRHGRIIVEQYWDVNSQHLNFNIHDSFGNPSLKDSLEIGLDLLNINVNTNLAGKLFIDGNDVEILISQVAVDLTEAKDLLSSAMQTKYEKIGGDISGNMTVSPNSLTELTVSGSGVYVHRDPTAPEHVATKNYVDTNSMPLDLNSLPELV